MPFYGVVGVGVVWGCIPGALSDLDTLLIVIMEPSCQGTTQMHKCGDVISVQNNNKTHDTCANSLRSTWIIYGWWISLILGLVWMLLSITIVVLILQVCLIEPRVLEVLADEISDEVQIQHVLFITYQPCTFCQRLVHDWQGFIKNDSMMS